MNESTSRKCPQCGTELPADAPAGLCPRCVMELNLRTETVLSGEAASTPPPSVSDLAPHFPQLEVIECLGRGGMGVVYKARQPQLDRFVAVKIMAPERVNDARFTERFLREARTLARLSHPNIVTVHDFGRAGAWFYLVMEFVDGVNLREVLRKGHLSSREALAIVPSICDALQYAHDRGVVHRDIKPENILLDRQGRVKIADFGIARLLSDSPESETAGAAASGGAGLTAEGVLGTPKYMAPEQVAHPTEVDHRADIYSLGVVFYEMLTGELPGKQIEPPSHKIQIDVRLDEVVLRALEKEPEQRYQQASVLKTRVEAVSEDLGRQVPAASPRSFNYQGSSGFNYRSKATWLGLPLVNIAGGVDPVTGKIRVARGIIAIGGIAQGVVAIGGIAMGGLALGGVALGLVGLGGMALGLLAFGGLVAGGLVNGGLAAGLVAFGGLAIGLLYAGGGLSIGLFAGKEVLEGFWRAGRDLHPLDLGFGRNISGETLIQPWFWLWDRYSMQLALAVGVLVAGGVWGLLKWLGHVSRKANQTEGDSHPGETPSAGSSSGRDSGSPGSKKMLLVGVCLAALLMAATFHFGSRSEVASGRFACFLSSPRAAAGPADTAAVR